MAPRKRTASEFDEDDENTQQPMQPRKKVAPLTRLNIFNTSPTTVTSTNHHTNQCIACQEDLSFVHALTAICGHQICRTCITTMYAAAKDSGDYSIIACPACSAGLNKEEITNMLALRVPMRCAKCENWLMVSEFLGMEEGIRECHKCHVVLCEACGCPWHEVKDGAGEVNAGAEPAVDPDAMEF